MKDADFCRRLKRLRKQTRKSQQQLADDMGVTQGLIHQYETGKSLPGLKQIKALCKALDCSSKDLLGI